LLNIDRMSRLIYLMDELSLTLGLQALSLLTPIMRGLSFLGQQEFFLVLIPIVFTLVSPRAGMRLAFVLLIGYAVNSTAKLALHMPRPYWVDARVAALATEANYGLPSGHAQTIAVWLTLGDLIRRPWAWVAMIAIAFLVGVSRIYLGVHFAGDVFCGWALGVGLLALLAWLEAPVAAWVGRRSFGQRLGLSAIAAAAIVAAGAITLLAVSGSPDPAAWARFSVEARSLGDFVSASGSIFGLCAGLTLSARAGIVLEGASRKKRAIRFGLALAGALVFWVGLKLVFPTEPEALGQLLRWIRYALTTVWLAFGAMWLGDRLVGAV
jgi:membrane-associated phospholipid phosphatase